MTLIAKKLARKEQIQAKATSLFREKGFNASSMRHLAENLGMEAAVLDMDGMTTDMALKLARGEVKTLDDFAGLSGDELLEIVGSDAISLDRANEMIMAARAHWFVDA